MAGASPKNPLRSTALLALVLSGRGIEIEGRSV
jgi:hypothetical protein